MVLVRIDAEVRLLRYDATRAFLAYAGDSSSVRLRLHWSATSPRPALVRYDAYDAFPLLAAEWESSSSTLQPEILHTCAVIRL